MTAPEDPFRSPAPGSHPPGQDPAGTSGWTGQPQQPGQPKFGEPAFGQHRTAPRNGLGVAALVLGVLALVTGLFFLGGALGIAAIVLGVLGRGRVKRGEATNGGMAIAGIVLGVAGVLLTALAVFGTVSLLRNSEFSDLVECLRSAGGDRAAQQQCQSDFADSVGG